MTIATTRAPERRGATISVTALVVTDRRSSSGAMEVRKVSNSSTTTEAELSGPVHPGEILMEDLIGGFGLRPERRALREEFAGINPLVVE